MMINSRIPRDTHKQSMITWVLLTISFGLLCQVRDTAAVKCFDCKAKTLEDQCYLDDKVGEEKDCPLDGCITYRVGFEGTKHFVMGGRFCLTQAHLDCIHSHLGLDLKDARCLKTTQPFEKVDQVGKCLAEKGQQGMDDNARQGGQPDPKADLRICTCKGDLCNKAAIWKPDEFKHESGVATLQGHVAWLCVTIAIVLLALCPFQ